MARLQSAFVLFVVVLASAWQPSAYADDWAYTLRPGDDLWTVARAYCGSSKRAQDIARHNGLGNPASVRAGTRINIPTRWLAFAPSRARLVSVTGVVSVRPYQRRNSIDAQAEMDINMGDVVTTVAGSAQVEFADGSTLVIAPNSEVLFNKLTAFGPAGMVDTHLRFFQGQGTARVNPQNLGDRFRIQTPEGIAAVRGTVFRVGHETRLPVRSRAETLEGRVAFLQDGKATTDLPQGFGVVASASGVTKESLLDAPDWLDANQANFAREDKLRWRAVSNASGYIVTWYAQGAPEVIYQQDEVSQSEVEVDVEPGPYRVQVRAISQAGLHGYEGQRDVTVLSAAPVLAPIVGDDTDAEVRDIQLRWQAPAGQTYTVEVQTAGQNQTRTYTTRDSHLFLPLPPGTYTWQVSSSGSAASPASTFTLAPPAVNALAASAQRKTLKFSWEAFAEPAEYAVEVRNSSGALIHGDTTNNNTLSVAVDDFDTYTLTVVPTQNGIQGPSARIDAMPQRSPWWLLLLLVPALFI